MQNVLVTGSTGFIGSRLCVRLKDMGVNVTCNKDRLDLPASDTPSLLNFSNYDTVFHLAGLVGGITYNINHPADMFMQNMRINLNVLDAWVRAKTCNLVIPGSSCAYPDIDIPLHELFYMSGYPHWTNFSYAQVKRATLTALKAGYEQHGLNYAYPILANVYGPGVRFDKDRLHAIPSLTYKFLDTSKPVEVLGAGRAIRDYLYIDDAVSAIIHSADHGNDAMNYGTGCGTSISQIVNKLSIITGRSDIHYMLEYPEGHMVRVLDCKMATSKGWTPKISLDTGLENTLNWVKAYMPGVS